MICTISHHTSLSRGISVRIEIEFHRHLKHEEELILRVFCEEDASMRLHDTHFQCPAVKKLFVCNPILVTCFCRFYSCHIEDVNAILYGEGFSGMG